jgi:CheY-like chemotaxis protein
MATVLVVDDSPVERQRAGALLERPPGILEASQRPRLTVTYAENGEEALALLDRQMPDVVVSDLRMPGVDGLQLVEAIKVKCPGLPVILMTAYGSEEIALLALQSGAAGYVPKRNLAADLLGTVHNVLETVQARRGHQRVLGCLTEVESNFVLDNDPGLVAHLTGHLRDQMREVQGCDDNELLRVSIALREALVNAIEHGNLEVPSALREESDRAYTQLVAERGRHPPYRDRRVQVRVRQTPREAVFVIRDGGPGFDPSRLPDPTDPANLEKSTGRGLMLVRTFMDEVRHNEAGNEITLVKRSRR